MTLRGLLVTAAVVLCRDVRGQAVWEAPSTIDPLRASNGWVATIPFADDGNPFLIMVRARLAGITRWWLIDSGTGRCQVSKELAARLPRGGTGRVTVTLATGAMVACDSLVPENMRAWTNDLGRPIDGVLGYDLFSRYVVQIDYAAHAMRLYDPAVYRYAGHGDTIALTFDARHPRILVHITDGSLVAIRRAPYLVTGSGDGVNDSLVASSPTAPRYQVETSNDGISGTAIEGTLQSVQLGRYSLANVPSTADGPGIIGGAALRQFTCIMDFRHSRLFIEPNEHFGDVFDRGPRSGLTFLASSVSRAPIVAAVIPGSPGAAAGILAGDVIEELDGHASPELGADRIERLINRAGNSYDLVIVRHRRRLRIMLRV